MHSVLLACPGQLLLLSACSPNAVLARDPELLARLAVRELEALHHASFLPIYRSSLCKSESAVWASTVATQRGMASRCEQQAGEQGVLTSSSTSES